MTKYIISCLVLAMACNAAFCGDVKYPVSAIADSLKTGANAVKRYEELIIEIKSPGDAKVTTRHAYTILNEDAVSYGVFVGYYNKLHDIGSISGTLFDQNGKEIKSVKKKDLQDLSGNDESALMSDTRYKRHDFYYRSYPYTVEYEQEQSYNGMLDLPDWYPQPARSISVENSRLIVIAPKDYAVRFKNVHFNGNPTITENGSKKIYTWEVKNLKAIQREIFSPSLTNIVPAVLVAPSDFEIEGYKGNMDTWLNFGKFINKLMEGRDALPENVKQQVHVLTDGITDDRKKIAVLYNYLQKNSRYISIQLGIGGWQPFDASFVSSKKYGDCKALSNYMVALLKEAGIKSNYVLIKAGDDAEEMVEDFPSNQFNHATVCVPLGKDSIWLECTSQTRAEGYTGDFTGNRKALLMDENGGHVVFTKKYTADDNFLVRRVDGVIEADGNLNARVNAIYACEQQDVLNEMMNRLTKKEQLEYLKKKINLPTYDIKSFDYQEIKQAKPQVKELIELQSSGYATVSGKRMFVTPNILARYTSSLKKDTVRQYDITFDFPFNDEDSVLLSIPNGYSVESCPKNVSLSTKFGAYDVKYNIEGNKISYIRKFNRKDGTFPASDYNVLADFYNDISKADRSRIVFVKKE